jgi:hypothetical protein
MLQRPIRRLAIAAALLSLLSLTPPVQAAGWGPAVPSGYFFKAAQRWIAGFLGRPVETGKKPRGLKSGMGIDPDGAPRLVTPTPCQTDCARGSSDPQSH